MATINEAFEFVKDPATPRLGLRIHGKSLANGEHIRKAGKQITIPGHEHPCSNNDYSETHEIPQLFLSSPQGTYLVVMLDLDGPFPSFPLAAPILHWLQPGLKGSTSTSTGDGDGEVDLTAPGVHYVVNYHGAGPPPGSGPHRYISLLYEQPEDFDGKKFGQPEPGKKIGIPPRVRWGFERFVKEAKLGRPVAGNWFVSN
jgi:phosphatidylethanolamine-binding protein